MKSRIWMAGVGVCLAMGMAGAVSGAEYYINDTYVPGEDIYTSATGNDGNPGTAALPKATVGNVIGTCNLQPGDVVYIDTGTYGSGAVISNTVVGTAVSGIRFQGSTNAAAGGTVFSGSGVNLKVQGSYLELQDVRVVGGTEGIQLDGAKNCTIRRILALDNTLYAYNLATTAHSNLFEYCLSKGVAFAIRTAGATPRDNAIAFCTFQTEGTAFSIASQCITSMVHTILSGQQAFTGMSSIPLNGRRNIFNVGCAVQPALGAHDPEGGMT